MRGGQPRVQVQWLYDDAFTPHARGSTRRTIGTVLVLVILPACAGVNLMKNVRKKLKNILPACAGVNLLQKNA